MNRILHELQLRGGSGNLSPNPANNNTIDSSQGRNIDFQDEVAQLELAGNVASRAQVPGQALARERVLRMDAEKALAR